MSQPGASGGQPTSFHANVNRAKTKKWVEAKSYSYDGDDWGEVDDYDEYGGYDEPEPEPSPRPTGLRQRGQSASQLPQEAYQARQDLYQSPIDARQHANPGGTPPQQQQQQQYGGRSFTNPEPQHHPTIARTNSFDRDDERRAFSAGGPQQNPNNAPSGNYSASPPQGQSISGHDFQPDQVHQSLPGQTQPGPAKPPLHVPGRSSMEGHANYGEQNQSPGSNHRGISYSDQPRQQGMGSRTQSMASNNSALDFHNRRDFSPSAMPPPLHTRGSPSPHGPDSRSSSRHPPRKSSLGQDSAPTLPFSSQAPPIPDTRDLEDSGPPTRDRAGSGAGKPLPFVRPADIYRRMQEEKEKERQSQESSRPTPDTILGRPNDRPSVAKTQDSESSQWLKPTLDPVSERKSEYGTEGLNVDDHETPAERRPTSSKTFDFPKRASKPASQALDSSLGPMLPDVSRISGFGESFFGTTDDRSQGPMLDFSRTSSSQPVQMASQTVPGKDLQHQPSLGFTSAVHQAFDKAEDQVPPTPNSTQGSSVGRSTSGGTSTVSPIISRGPSTATESWNSRLPSIDNVHPPTILEGQEGVSPKITSPRSLATPTQIGGDPRPVSSSSFGTPTQIIRKPFPSQATSPQPLEELPPSFIPGYRRNSNTPSPDNSPARTPALETNRQLRQPQEVELAAVTPTEPSFSTGSSSQASEVASEEGPDREQSTKVASGSDYGPTMDSQAGARKVLGNTDLMGSPMSPVYNHLRGRTDSSSSSRVRNLADKFESGSRPGSAHSTTPRASMLGADAQKKDDPLPPRPLADRMESFRPHLPGGWESSASIAPAAAYNASQSLGFRQQPDKLTQASEPAHSSSDLGKGLSEDMSTSAPDQNPSSVTQIKDASEEAFAAVAAAGTALAGAFGAAIGMEHHDPPTDSTTETQANEQAPIREFKDREPAAHPRGALHPEASRPYLSNLTDDEDSTAAPTPLPKETPLEPGEHSESPDYFSSSPHNKDTNRSVDPKEDSTPLKQLPNLPLLTTDPRPEQYESDRLRKEIVRELTPMSASEPTTAETDYSNYQATLSTNPSVIRPRHESGVLPREYESYWNDENSDDEGDDLSREPSHVENPTTAKPQQAAAVDVQPLQPKQEQGRGPPVPTAQDELSQGTPHILPHRFSWEQPLHSLGAVPEPVQEQPVAPSSDFLKSTIYPMGHSFQPQEELRDAYQSPSLSTVTDPLANESPTVPDEDSHVLDAGDVSDHSRLIVDDEKELPSYPSGLEVAPSVLEKHLDGSLVSGHTDNANYISQQSPLFQHEQRQELESTEAEPPARTTSDTPANSVDLPPLPPPSNAQPKIPAFREILALSSANERIRAYNGTQVQFANLNTGLAHWLAATSNDLPEHADLLASSGRPAPNFQGHKPSPSRSKLGGLLPSGGQSSQQLYFQPPAPDGSVIGAGPSQGFSPSGGSSSKLSSQQVQAKGKDLLHTAGIFGGKANVAAKGLFSKGKSKLRAASGNEKAPSQPTPSPAPLSRGMQQQPPSVKAQPLAQAPPDLRADLSKAVAQAASPEPRYSSPNSQQRSPRDTPSLKSFTQSQLGDDERSEESEPTSQDHPPRTSNLYLKRGLTDRDGSRPVQGPVIVGDSAPVFLHQTQSADSYIGSPKEIHTPRSTTSSNRTPTQAHFVDGGPYASHPSRQDAIENGVPPGVIREESNSHDSTGTDPGRFSPLQSRSSTQVPHNPEGRTVSGDSKGTFRNVKAGRNPKEISTQPSYPSNLPNAEVDRILRAPARMNALAASQLSPTAVGPEDGGTELSKSKPRSSTRDTLGVPRPSQDYSVRGPSIDSIPSRIDPDRPPSPVSPQQSTIREIMDQHGRAGPIHYGLDHDFVPDSDNDGNKSQSRSKSRTVANSRPSQDSRRSYEPNIHDHPAFRPSPDLATQSSPCQIPRNEIPMPRQQAPEYQLEGAGNSIEWPPESKSRSRRSSRSSAFFKSLTLGGSSKVDEPPLPDALDIQTSSSPVTSPAAGEKKGKRTSILRSLTGNSGSGSGSVQSKGNVTPTKSHPQYAQPTQVAPTQPPQAEDDEFPSRGNSRSASSKFSKRLQRSSTSGNTDQDGGKKKRFSGLGSLFGRGNTKQVSSSESRLAPSQQTPATTVQQRDPNAMISSSKLQQSGYGPGKEQIGPPPPGGYYAPRAPQGYSAPPPSNPRLQRNGQSSSWAQDAPAYVQDAALRQRVEQRMSPLPQAQNIAPPRPSATFPQTTPQISPSSVARASTVRSRSREPFPQRPGDEKRPSGNSWTRFSQHGRSKSRQLQPLPPSNTPQQPLTLPPTTYSPPPTSNVHQIFQQPNPRSDSPPPPPPPPKDDWHRPRPRESTSGTPGPRGSQYAQSPSQSSNRPLSTIQNRQSLPPLQTDVEHKRQSAVASGNTLTPEEKRRSRQKEIEKSTMSPQIPENSIRQVAGQVEESEDEPVVMSATSFPHQMWQPEFAHWDGD